MSADLAIKEPCRVATVANVTTSGLQTIDGVALAAGDRVLVKAQTSAVDNGIWVAASGAWSRATDFDANGEVVGGTEVLVTSGTELAGSSWRVAGAAPVVIGTTLIAFERAVDPGRDVLTLADRGTRADMLSALAAVYAERASGGLCLVNRGSWVLSGTSTFTGDRLHLWGDGEYSSTIVFNPAAADVALENDHGNVGGTYQASFRNLSFYSSNYVDKTAIRLVNAGNCDIEYVSISGGTWFGEGSIGILTEGRQFIRVRNCTIACARPYVGRKNLVWPTLSGDHGHIQGCEFAGSSPTRPVIEFESGTMFTNLTVSTSAIAGGREGIKWDDRDSQGAGYHLHLHDLRFEQGIDPIAFNIYLATSGQSLQELLVENVRLDGLRQGMFLRRCQRVTLSNVNFANGSTPLLLLTALVAGTGGNAIATTGSVSGGGFTSPTLVYGQDGVPAIGQPGVAATGRFMLASNPADGNTITIGSRVYTFKSALTAAGQVKIAASVYDTLGNLRDAIIGAPGDGSTTGPGFTYGAGTTAHPDVTARGGSIVPLMAKAAGTAGNALATTGTLANGSFGGSTLSGGTSSEHASGILSLSAQPAPGETVTIGSRTYTFRNPLTGAANEVLIGATSIDSAHNLRDAVNAAEGNYFTGPGITYGAGTAAHADVFASGDVALDMEFSPGSRLVMINCFRQTGSVIRLTNAICVRREHVSAVGMVEEWIYRANAASGNQVSDAYWGGLPVRLVVGEIKAIADSTFTGFFFVSASDDVSAIYAARGATGAVAEVSDHGGAFSPTKGTAGQYNLFYESGEYRLENKRAGTATVSVFRLGTSV